MTHAGRLRPLLPRSGSQMRPKPFQIERTFQDKAPVDTSVLGVTEKAKQEFDRCSMGQKRHRQKEQENRAQSELLCGPKLLNSHRSAAQRARRQRELAEQIEELLQAKGPKNM
ncbi:hypothetical protein DFH09DRAFT_1074081 [Mycena vulgaris]|nr:hypothetical protein DFH09DRAFT_1074081 [Mycena vulgaris]